MPKKQTNKMVAANGIPYNTTSYKDESGHLRRKKLTPIGNGIFIDTDIAQGSGKVSRTKYAIEYMKEIVDYVYQYSFNAAMEEYKMSRAALNKIVYATPDLHDYVEECRKAKNQRLADRMREKVDILVDSVDESKLLFSGVKDTAIAAGVFLDKSDILMQNQKKSAAPVFIMGAGSKVTRKPDGTLVAEVVGQGDVTVPGENVIDVTGTIIPDDVPVIDTPYSEVDEDDTEEYDLSVPDFSEV